MSDEKLTFHDCCRAVHEAAKTAKPHSLLHYAATYALAGMQMTGKDEMRVQAAYILNNLQHWRGDEARRVKIRLREYAEGTE